MVNTKGNKIDKLYKTDFDKLMESSSNQIILK